MKYAFFPGCSLESTAWDFDRSTRAVCRGPGHRIGGDSRLGLLRLDAGPQQQRQSWRWPCRC